MFTARFDNGTAKKVGKADERTLARYQEQLDEIAAAPEATLPEHVLTYPALTMVRALRDQLSEFRKITTLFLVGIGGSSLGTEAVHAIVGQGNVRLITLDMVDAEALARVETLLPTVRRLDQLAVCVVSKSGATTETLANAAVLLRMLEGKFGVGVYGRTVYVGDPKTSLAHTAKKLSSLYIPMPAAIGGRYSVCTEVGLVPLILLGHDVESFVAGFMSGNDNAHVAEASASALRLLGYLRAGYRHYNLFVFSRRLERLAAWYRQLMAESLGKSVDRAGLPVRFGWLPTITSPVELHSVGQLYFSKFPGIYTDFLSLESDVVDYAIGPTKIASTLRKFTVGEVSAALYGGVVAAYQEQDLAHHAVVFSEEAVAYDCGQYMHLRMRETMYLGALLGLNPFDQPNVEIYKQKTRSLLGL